MYFQIDLLTSASYPSLILNVKSCWISFANSVWYSGYKRRTSTNPPRWIHFKSQYVNAYLNEKFINLMMILMKNNNMCVVITLTSLLLFTTTSCEPPLLLWEFPPWPLELAIKCIDMSQPTKSPLPVIYSIKKYSVKLFFLKWWIDRWMC